MFNFLILDINLYSTCINVFYVRFRNQVIRWNLDENNSIWDILSFFNHNNYWKFFRFLNFNSNKTYSYVSDVWKISVKFKNLNFCLENFDCANRWHRGYLIFENYFIGVLLEFSYITIRFKPNKTLVTLQK